MENSISTIIMDRVSSFEKKFGKSHFDLACHAALPLLLTPDLLYSIHSKFLPQVPWIAVSDLLLSTLCNEVGYELFEMETETRNFLLKTLEEDRRYGRQRISELAYFLLDYLSIQKNKGYPNIQGQRLTALAYTDLENTVIELADTISKIKIQDHGKLLQIISLIKTLDEPLKKDFTLLLTYANGMENFIRGNLEIARIQFKKISRYNNHIQVAGVYLDIPLKDEDAASNISGPIFISHSSKDDSFVKELCRVLESLGLSVWIDSRELTAAERLEPEIERQITEARYFIVVFSLHAMNSSQVRREVQKALEVQKLRGADEYKIIPLLLPGVDTGALGWLFPTEPVALKIDSTATGLNDALPEIWAALGMELLNDSQPVLTAPLTAELKLKLYDAQIFDQDGKRRVKAMAQMVYHPPVPGARQVESTRFSFTAPLGPIEADDLRWYLEQYYLWPTGEFRNRAAEIEAKLPSWGRDLYQAVTSSATTRTPLEAWKNLSEDIPRYFSVQVDSELPDDSSLEAQSATKEAAGVLLTIPWELLHNGRSYLFQGKNAVTVRRRLPNHNPQEAPRLELPIRILLVSPRPEDEHTSFLDHRSSALPLVEAVESLGELAKLTILTPPTYVELEHALQRAAEANQQYTIIHFDGYGVYDRAKGLGAFCFEDANDINKLEGRGMEIIQAENLAAIFRDYRIPLVFLDACQSAKVEVDLSASVAAKLMEEGVTSVVAMSYNVLVEAATRFVGAFYQELAHGARVGGAMLAGRKALFNDTFRGKIMGAGELRMQDWFVPVLYQEEQDPCLITKLPAAEVQRIQEQKRRLSLGKLPGPPAHKFLGRSRELLALERLLSKAPYAVIRGMGGTGKTSLAVEVARWLSRTGRFEQVAFVSLEIYSDAKGILDFLGKQLLPEGEGWSVATYPDLEKAKQPVERALHDQATLIVVDNVESVLPEVNQEISTEVKEIFELCQGLLQADVKTRLLFTSREPLPEPFNHQRREIAIGNLAREDAIQLVNSVLVEQGLAPKRRDPGETTEEISELVEAVHCHARALVLLAPELCSRGIRATIENLGDIMIELDRAHPGTRERSLYASVELSLRRLPAKIRKKINGLGVLQGGADLYVFAKVLKLKTKKAEQFAKTLVEVGLVEEVGYSYFRFDPALAPYLFAQMNETEREEARNLWDEGIDVLVGALYEQFFKNTEVAVHLAMLEISNILAWLEWINNRKTPEKIIEAAESVLNIFSKIGYSRVLAKTTEIIESAERRLGSQWNHSRYLIMSNRIERYLGQGELQTAYDIAQQLLKYSLDAGKEAYDGAEYDISMAYLTLGKILKNTGLSDTALQPLVEAQKNFQRSVSMGNDKNAERMYYITLTEIGDCLRNLGRLSEAVAIYTEGAELAERSSDQRGLAVTKFQLGTITLLQKRYEDALALYNQARNIFTDLGEARSVASSWHQIAMVYRETEQYAQAEQAYRQSLAIEVQQKNRLGEATTLGELGNLYYTEARFEDAIIFYKQAGDIYMILKDQYSEGRTHRNSANALIQLTQYDEARQEVLRAIELEKPFGHSAEPWTAWSILFKLEQKTGNPQAANEAKQMARQCYLEYRRDGGESKCPGGECCVLVEQAIREGKISEAEQELAQLLEKIDQSWVKVLIPKLLAILQGKREPALAEDPELDYDDAAELELLLERLNGNKQNHG